LLGGDDDDKVNGDKGLDVLIGGRGEDNLKGGHDDDILIGSVVVLSDDLLGDVRDIWTNGSSYADRVADLTTPTPTGTGLLVPDTTVLDDDAEDTLRGQNDRDLFFAKLGGSDKDKVKDKKSIEELLTLL